MRLLVVDDDEVFREELSTFLSDEGHQVETAPSARKALDVLETGEREIVFTDLKMPRQSGLDLLREIRQKWPRTYVIVITGFATVPTAVEAMKLGAFEYIGKPFRGEQVRQVLRLVADERSFSDASLPLEDPHALAASLAKTHKVPMLLLTDKPGRSSETVSVRPFDGKDPARLMDEIEAFYNDHEKGGVVLARVDRILIDHRLDDIVDLLRRIRDRVQDRGPFAIGFDPKRVSRDAATAVRSVLVANQVHGALEAIASPIRRRVLLRLAEAPAAFSDVMHSAELDDSPKLSFHLHRLVDEGLVVHAGERYKLTAKGEGAVTLLHEMERLATGSTAGAVLFETQA
ncbi:MAG: response regulator [Thermoplasmata archaeon]|nr:response regulator [Thermoplasmata archaeon]MCI4354053.1 response regulator [Thermoplasmata archaeon]